MVRSIFYPALCCGLFYWPTRVYLELSDCWSREFAWRIDRSLRDFAQASHFGYGIGEFETLNKLRIEVIYYCSVLSCGDFSQAKAVVSNETDPVLVLTHGGGDTCMWKIPCLKHEKLVQVFPDREILVFPQSVKFVNIEALKAHATAMKHPNISIS